jgi:hypothetical protein
MYLTCIVYAITCLLFLVTLKLLKLEGYVLSLSNAHIFSYIISLYNGNPLSSRTGDRNKFKLELKPLGLAALVASTALSSRPTAAAKQPVTTGAGLGIRLLTQVFGALRN